jgi:hypothetical protein
MIPESLHFLLQYSVGDVLRMIGIGISDGVKTGTEDIKAASSGSCDGGEYGVVQQDRVVSLPANEREPVEESHCVGACAFGVGRKEC